MADKKLKQHPKEPAATARGIGISDDDGREEKRWRATQDRLREQRRRFHQAGNVRQLVEVMLESEVDEGTRRDDEPMSPAALDKRKQRIKDWLGQLVRLELAQEARELAKAKMTKQTDSDGVLVSPGLVMDHRAMMNLFEKRPDITTLWEAERNAIENR